ncbi:hypothetical protein AXG93_2035s1280 [Marchantia polymorpha subsp. ruderalis]|uniref:CCHC-type domain-containing protein n=1 Tax=Marchantia polymorpha subsp. ruderalis TaxID=1480154 RepID=A0A176VSD1_MARPO|nr:hypothetical protein AXG93_2035s1280 [Marchantia polymorpha subsp. ruderalis]
MVIMHRARFQYQPFLGKRKQDAYEWIEDFIDIAQANVEDAIKLSTLAGLLREEARPCSGFSDSSSSSDSSSDFEAFSSLDKGFDKWKKKKQSTKKSKSASSKEDKSSKKFSTSKGLSGCGLIRKEKKGLDGKMNDLANQLKVLSVHFAGLPSNRMKPPISQAHVWCVRCKQLGHAPNECSTWHPQVQMPDEELVDQYGLSLGEHVEFFYEEASNLVYQVSTGTHNLHHL